MQEQLKLTHPPTPKPIPSETEARDTALDALEKWRAKAVELGREVALRIVRERGRVTSVEVFAAMREAGHGDLLDSIDPRWAGCLFRKGWKRDGWEPRGSHGRPVAIWRREGER